MVWKPPYVSPDPVGSAAPAPIPNAAPDAAPASTGGGWKPPYVSPEPTVQQPPPPPDQSNDVGNFWSLTGPGWDPSKSKPADLSRPQTWTDWATRTYSASPSQIANAVADDLTLGGGNIVRSKVTGEDLATLRANTAKAQEAMGPMGPITAAATYAIPGGGELEGAAKLAKFATPGGYLGTAAKMAQPYVGRYGAAAAEGAAANALSYAGHTAYGPDFNPLDLGVHAVTGAGIGAGAQGVADAASPAIRRVADYVSGKTGRAGENWGANANLRSDYQAGQDISPDLDSMIDANRNRLSPNDPAMIALRNAKDATNQSIKPGIASRLAIYPTLGYTGALAGQQLPGLNEAVGGVTGFGFGELAAKSIGEPIARGVNQIDKNIAVNEALDRLYPYATGQPRSTVNLAPFTQAVRQSAIANARGPSDALNRYIITGRW